MTTDPSRPTPRPPAARRKRPHPAATARTVAAGAAAVGTCALVAVFGLTGTEVSTAPSATTPSSASETTVAPAITYIPPASTGAPSDTIDPGWQRTAAPPSVGTAGNSAPATRSSSS